MPTTEMFSQPILILGPQQKPYIAAITERFSTVYKYWEIEDKDRFIAEQGDSIVGVATNAIAGIERDMITKLPNLQIIVSSGVGYNTIDVAFAHQKGIVVTNTPEVLNDCVADTGMMLIYAVARQLVPADRYVRAGKWAERPYPLTTSLKNKVCGIVGLGGIGSAIAQRASACGMRIAYTARHDKNIPNYQYVSDIGDLATISDFLVIAVPYTPETEHLVNAEILQKLGKNGYLINIARGAIVDEKALVAALQNGTIAGAGLDVFEHEPYPNEALLTLDNVVLTPHFASGTFETRKAMTDLAVANLVEYFTNGKVLTAIPAE